MVCRHHKLGDIRKKAGTGRRYLTTICGTTARLQKGRMFSFTVDTTDVRLYARVVVFSFTVDTTDLFRRRRVVQVRERPPALRLVLAVKYGVEYGGGVVMAARSYRLYRCQCRSSPLHRCRF